MLPLELWLKSKASKSKNRFPRAADYFSIYEQQKAKFVEHIYPHVNAGLVAREGGDGVQMYTDHGVGHVEAVIKVAGLLLGCRDAKSAINLDPYEVFLLLICILAHDAGNIEGRAGHELKVAKMLNNPLTKAISETAEVREIHEIARAHTAKGLVSGKKEKDTISSLKVSDNRLGIPYRKRAIASLLRLADEICEDQSRIPLIAFDSPDVVNGPSAPHLYYGKSISSVNIDITNKSIDLQFEIEECHIFTPLSYVDTDGTQKSKYLIEEILSRLHKLRLEWIYCSRYLRGVVEIDSITASISVLIDNAAEYTQDLVNIVTMNLSDVGYPEDSRTLVSQYSLVEVENLKQSVNSEKEKRR